MRVRVFRLTLPPSATSAEAQLIAVPTLSNYAIRGPSELSVNGVTQVEGTDYELDWEGSELHYFPAKAGFSLDGEDGLVLKVYYTAILDYEVLFGWVVDPGLRSVISMHYREVDACLDAGAWTAAALMAGAVLEGILLDRARTPRAKTMLDELITNAEAGGTLTPQEATTGRKLKELRNHIHPENAHRTGMTDRPLALRAVVLLERLIELKWS